MEERRTLRIDGVDLAAVFHVPAHPVAWVVCLHGLESNKDGGKPLALAARLVPKNIGVVRFDFRGCGESGGEFLHTNIATRIADTRAVLKALEERPGGRRVGLFGSSMGGYVALFMAVDPAYGNRIEATVALASPANLDDLSSAPDGIDRMHAFAEEYRGGGYRAVPVGQRNVLLLHGAADEVVPVSHAEAIWQGLAEPRAKHIFDTADHRFSNTVDLDAGMNEAADWFLRCFEPKPLP